MDVWISMFYMYVCRNGLIKHKTTQTNATWLFKWFRNMFWKIRMDINWLKLTILKDVTKFDSAKVTIDSERYVMWFKSNIILL